MNLDEYVRRIEEGRPVKVDPDTPAPGVQDILDRGEHVVMDGDGEFHGVKKERVDNSPINNVKLPKDQMNRNMKRLLAKFRTGEDFLVIGRAGWGKTSVIKNLAQRFGYINLPTIILATADPTDLGGRPYNDKDERTGKIKQGATLPPWAQEIYDNPQKKYLVFFDEINQASYEVMNTLMEIILEHKVASETMSNFFVGSAGNEKGENTALQQIENNKPLLSRLLPVIQWEVQTEAAWHNAFEYLHEKYDKLLGKSFIDEFSNLDVEDINIFDNPRNIERYIFKWMTSLKKKGSDWYDDFDATDYRDRLGGICISSQLNRSQEDLLDHIAEKMFECLNGNGDDEDDEEDSSNTRGRDMIPEFVKEMIQKGIKNGYYVGEDSSGHVKLRYGISRQNVIAAFTQKDENGESMLNAEQVSRFVKICEQKGIKFHFETDKEWQDKGYKDPTKDYDSDGNEI